MKVLLTFAFCLLLACHPALAGSLSDSGQSTDVRIGVLAKRGTAICLKRWGPTAEYLTEAVPGHRFSIVPLAFSEINPAVAKGEVDFILANPSIYVELEIRHGIRRIATMVNRVGDKETIQFGGVVFRRKDREGIHTLNDLRGKRFAAVDETSHGGWRMALGELKEVGIDPVKDFADLRFEGTHDAVVHAVLVGTADAGTVRTNALERLAAEGAISLEDIFVIPPLLPGPEHAKFPLLVSTRLYPEWPMAMLPHTREHLGHQVAGALLTMTEDSPATKAANIHGWTVASNYQPVHDLLKTLRVGPYKDFGKVTVAQMLRQYAPLFAILAALLVALAAFAMHSRRSNRQIKKTERHLESELEERRRVEKELRQANEEVETIIDNSMVGIVFYNPEARAIRVNQRFADMLGLDPEQLLQGGPQLSRLLEYLHTMLYSDSIAGIEDGESMRMERLLHSENGKPVWCDVSCRSIATPEIGQGLIFVFNDITERKHAENALKENEEHLKTILDSMHTGIMLVDSETQVVEEVNTFATNLLETPKQKIVGSKRREYVCIENSTCPLADLEQESDNSEQCLQAPDGRRIPVIRTVVPIQRAGRSYLLENFTDITEHKQLEQLREDVERVMRHDLKVPLNGIIGLPDLMLTHNNLNAEQKEFLTLIKEQGHRMLRLINLSLDLFKMETGSYQYEPKPVDFTTLSRTLLRDISGLAGSKGVELEATVQGAPPDPTIPLIAPAEESLSYSMLSNLLANAVEASPEGQKVSLRMEEEDRELVIVVHNMGAVPEEVRNTFFQKYATQGKKGGTGLGTYSAKLMAETMDGTIAFTSSEAEGTTVTVRLPRG